MLLALAIVVGSHVGLAAALPLERGGASDLKGRFAELDTRRADGVSTQVFENRQYTLKGLLLEESLKGAAGFVYSRTINTYEVRPVLDAQNQPLEPVASCLLDLAPGLSDEACRVQFVTIDSVETETAEPDPQTGARIVKRHMVQDLAFDRFGNVLESIDFADDATSDDDVYARVVYENRAADWLIGLPTELEVRAGHAGGDLLRSRQGTYGSNGELTSISIDTGDGLATTQLYYDAYGNVVRSVSPKNQANQSQTLRLRQ